MACKDFTAVDLVSGPRRLRASRARVEVVCGPEVERFDIRRADVVATAVADVEVPANGCPIAVGGCWSMLAREAGQVARLELLAARLVEIEPGPSRWQRVYRWQFLVVRRPQRDPFGLFPAARHLREGGVDILADLAEFLRSELPDEVVAHFNGEGGFRLGPG